jgi:membrane protein
MRFVFRVLRDAFMRFSQDDGWAIASHIALSILTSLFPFLIFVTALAGFFGSASLADEVHELAHILLQTWPQQVAAPIANEIHNVLTQTRSGLLTISVILAIYFSSSQSGSTAPTTSGTPGRGGCCGFLFRVEKKSKQAQRYCT